MRGPQGRARHPRAAPPRPCNRDARRRDPRRGGSVADLAGQLESAGYAILDMCAGERLGAQYAGLLFVAFFSDPPGARAGRARALPLRPLRARPLAGLPCAALTPSWRRTGRRLEARPEPSAGRPSSGCTRRFPKSRCGTPVRPTAPPPCRGFGGRRQGASRIWASARAGWCLRPRALRGPHALGFSHLSAIGSRGRIFARSL